EDRCLMSVVTTLTDNVAGSLRSAIAQATAVGGDGVVEFAAGLTGPSTLTAGQLTINSNVTINGPGASNITVNAGGANRVFDIAATALNVSIIGLGITRAAAAAGCG